MSKPTNLRKAKIIFGLVVTVFMYLYFSSPGKVVVDVDGDVNSLINSIRASLQGKDFWKNQLEEVNSELEWELGEPQRRAKLNHEMNHVFKEVDQSMEDMYQKHPDMKPSAAERQAESLRERADQIEQQELDRYIENIRLKRIAELRSMLPIVRAKAE